jgi:GDP-L-fucose synthase
MNKNTKIYIAGHAGMVGSAILSKLKSLGYTNLLTRSRNELDLTNQEQVKKFFKQEKPEYLFLAAAKVGGIQANNNFRADFIYQNLMIEANILNSAFESGVKRLLFLGSSCIYPRDCPQPIKEEYLMSGPLEDTNEPYAIAKIAGIKLCDSFNRQYGTSYLSVMPTNLYGPNDNYDLNNSHVLPALIRKVHQAKVNSEENVVVWGTGKPRREFLYVDDMADACVFLMESNISKGIFNVGTGVDLTIEELASIVISVVGYKGKIVFDISKPDGTPRKLLDVEQLKNMGWTAKINLIDGIHKSYEDYLKRSL